ncbi:hypothetical protein L3Y25_gp109 [Gordonia phage Syleon]|uniref:Uncharacterized protein n=1 Tax=Gordonia phage Syleon TaxID=2653718 RepID=A0A5Q2WH64_9CAUD|nr:hypothetical protein L3Y25_gp109 [Gordonia phage Syleon]QGH75855.1 hypothetical protein SEA_SYLEON_132 [Gordonia phage Syleon]
MIGVGVLVVTVLVMGLSMRLATPKPKAKPSGDVLLMMETRSKRQIRRDARDYRAKYREFHKGLRE